MSGSWRFKIKKAHLVALSVPVALVVSSAILPLKPIIQQVLMLVLLVWFQVTALLGFTLGK